MSSVSGGGYTSTGVMAHLYALRRAEEAAGRDPDKVELGDAVRALEAQASRQRARACVCVCE
jgi:hypothetical protein